MRIVVRVFIAMMWTVSLTAAEPKHGEFASETVQVADVSREYRLVVPKSVVTSPPVESKST